MLAIDIYIRTLNHMCEHSGQVESIILLKLDPEEKGMHEHIVMLSKLRRVDLQRYNETVLPAWQAGQPD